MNADRLDDLLTGDLTRGSTRRNGDQWPRHRAPTPRPGPPGAHRRPRARIRTTTPRTTRGPAPMTDSVSTTWEPWPDDAEHRGLDAGTVAATVELVGELIEYGALTDDGLRWLLRRLREPRWAHCPGIADRFIVDMRERVAAEIVARSAPNAREAMRQWLVGTGDILAAPDDLAGILDDTDDDTDDAA